MAGRGERDPGGAAVAGVGLAVHEAGVQQLADQTADRVRRQLLPGRQLADPQRGGGQRLQQLHLRHGQRLPRVVGPDAAAQRAAQPGHDVRQPLRPLDGLRLLQRRAELPGGVLALGPLRAGTGVAGLIGLIGRVGRRQGAGRGGHGRQRSGLPLLIPRRTARSEPRTPVRTRPRPPARRSPWRPRADGRGPGPTRTTAVAAATAVATARTAAAWRRAPRAWSSSAGSRSSARPPSSPPAASPPRSAPRRRRPAPSRCRPCGG